MTSARDAANFFINLANCDEYGDGMTNMRLNKLLFFAQGHYFARTGNPLFEDEFEAWDYGPVVSDIYKRYKNYGRKPISNIDSSYDSEAFTPDEMEVLLDVAREYGKYSTSELVNISHSDNSPWATSFNSSSQIISKRQIKEYFATLGHLDTFDDVLSRINIPVHEKRDTDGFILLPKDEHDGDCINAV